MTVTIQMIGEKEFKIKPHGYDQDEVDEFLDEIADEFEAMENEIRDLNARLAALPEEVPAPAPAAAPVQPVQPPRSASSFSPELQQESITNLLVNAQRVCDETVAGAQAKAQAIVNDAQEKADKIVVDANAETQRLEGQMETLRTAASEYRARFQKLVDDQAQVLKEETELFRKAR